MVRPRPVGPRVLAKELEPQERRSSGLILPPEVHGHEHRLVVVEVGDFSLTGDPDREMPVGKGDVIVVACGARNLTPLRIDVAENGEFEDFLLVGVTDIAAVLEDVPTP